MRQQLSSRATPSTSLVHGDFCPKNLLVHDGTVAGFIDWEFEKLGWSNPASPAQVRRCLDVIARPFG
ncbi:phosphotransferase [Kribbella sp. DT2]|uniref:phosphotransferase n=1 Tax=Kribbella sp. DT2 TaxID=3393427 RepID=UPI003CE9F480